MCSKDGFHPYILYFPSMPYFNTFSMIFDFLPIFYKSAFCPLNSMYGFLKRQRGKIFPTRNRTDDDCVTVEVYQPPCQSVC